MLAKLAARFFLVLFLGFLTAPSVTLILKSNADISYVYALTEEENKTGEKTAGKIELNLHETLPLTAAFLEKQSLSFNYYHNSFESVYSELISPPPEA